MQTIMLACKKRSHLHPFCLSSKKIRGFFSPCECVPHGQLHSSCLLHGATSSPPVPSGGQFTKQGRSLSRSGWKAVNPWEEGKRLLGFVVVVRDGENSAFFLTVHFITHDLVSSSRRLRERRGRGLEWGREIKDKQ